MTTLSALVLAAGCSDDSPAEALQRKCKAFNSCFEETSLLGTWECDLGEGTTIEIDDHGRWSQRNGVGQVGAGCVTCDGDYEVVDTDESGSHYPHFAAFGSFAVDGDDAVWRNQHCLHSNLKACRAEPAASGNASCQRK
ncbi:MAG TPA: hypothetical protein VFZ61_12220 [Polyangiales bacterium]